MNIKELETKIERFLLLKEQNPQFEKIISHCEGKEYLLKLSTDKRSFSFGSILGSEILELLSLLLEKRKEEFERLAMEMNVDE